MRSAQQTQRFSVPRAAARLIGCAFLLSILVGCSGSHERETAKVSGVVILQITIGTDGTVSDARVLRSIPLLDGAAIEAVKQWQYDPGGRTAPAILTVSVPFIP